MRLEEITIPLDSQDRLPLYEQLYRYISREITQGHLAAGTKLPSRRRLSHHLGISQMTVDSAFELLKSEGFVQAVPKVGLFVQALSPLKQPETTEEPLPEVKSQQPPPRFDFSPQATDLDLFPAQPFIRMLRETLLKEPEVLHRGHPRGETSLREVLAQFLFQYRGVQCTANDLVIGSGVEHLLGIVASLLRGPTTVAVEDPGYPAAARAFENAGHQVCYLPLDEQGISPDVLSQSGASLAYLTPAHQYPLGISMPAVRRSELLHWANLAVCRYLIEDDYDSEFRFTSRPLPALHSMDDNEKVIYISTFSRTLASGIRMAYLVLPRELNTAYDNSHLRAGDAVSRFEQRAMARFLADGHYVRHLRRAANVYQKRLAHLSKLLLDIPDSFMSGQEAGLHFIFGIRGKTEQELVGRAGQAGIPLLGLATLCKQANCPPSLVMGFGGIKDDEVGEAVLALRAAWQV